MTSLSLWQVLRFTSLSAFLLAATVLNAAELDALGPDGVLRGPFVALDGHFSLLSTAANRSALGASFGYGARGGYRWNGWGLFAQVEHNLWLATEYETEVVQGAVDIGVGVELTYAEGFVRTSLAVGPSILAEDTILDDAGTTGLFVDFRPIGLRFAVHEKLAVGIDPIGFALVAPVLGGIPLIFTQYRTNLYLEASF